MSLHDLQMKIKSRKFVYRLMAKGIQKKARIFGMGIVDVNWKAPFISDPKFIHARTEELAIAEIKKSLKKHWIGFVIHEVTNSKT